MKFVSDIIFYILLLFSVLGYAGPTGPPPPGVPPPGNPIDNGLVLLFVLALVYGIYKIKKMKLIKKTPI